MYSHLPGWSLNNPKICFPCWSSLLRDWFPCAGAVLSLAQTHRAEEGSWGDWVTGEDKVMGGWAGQGWRTKRATQVPTDAHSTGEGVRARRVHVLCIAKPFQSCPTLCDPMGCNPPGSSVHGILQARIKRYDGELREPLMWRQGSQMSMCMARGSVSLLSSHGRGIRPQDALKTDS